jgi:hypothetical protein
MESYAGVDWASDKHDVLVVHAAGEKLPARRQPHQSNIIREPVQEQARVHHIPVHRALAERPLPEQATLKRRQQPIPRRASQRGQLGADHPETAQHLQQTQQYRS